MQAPSPIPYQALANHGVIGDRRTAALVAADGTLDWLCLPDYDGPIVCGTLLDAGKGGYWRLGPVTRSLGTQMYREDTAVLVTTWNLDGGRLELTDFMAGPEDDRKKLSQGQHVIVRRLRCVAGQARCGLQFMPAHNFEPAPLRIESPTLGHVPTHASVLGHVVAAIKDTVRGHDRAQAHPLWLWVSRPILTSAGGPASFELHLNEEFWAVLVSEKPPTDWSSERAGDVLAETEAYWKRWASRLSYNGSRARRVRLSALLIHLLSYAPDGSVVAAPTTSLPERIGGDWNADYRLTWVRDASLSLEMLSQLGNTDDARRFLEWLCRLASSTAAPVQVVYNVRGEKDLKEDERKDLYGYRGSKPVRFGNHAYQQRQLDSLGYLLHSISVYRQAGGTWHSEFWDLVRRVANHLADTWNQPDNSIWELSEQRQFVSGKVMSAIGLDRARIIAAQLGHSADSERWRAARDHIRAAVLAQGWSEKLGAFRQHYDGENLDAATLLLAVLDFLPPDDPRMVATIERIADCLSLDGFVYRFDPQQTPGVPQPALPLGEFEGAFLPCTFWLATAYAKLGQRDKAEAILSRAEACGGAAGLFAESVDPRTGDMLGNCPLLFSHAAYIRAVRALAGPDASLGQ